ncbi:hypothetical protein NW070_03745 [Mycoplasmopsis cynos]|nr:hypothetical protein [Mycoplasmopsis cynos]UWV77958.1 hypothetical protein NW070_03745 [Mycoplasmopsis cynos]
MGMEATTKFIKDLDITDEKGFIITDENMQTKIKGIFAKFSVILEKRNSSNRYSCWWWSYCCKENFRFT